MQTNAQIKTCDNSFAITKKNMEKCQITIEEINKLHENHTTYQPLGYFLYKTNIIFRNYYLDNL